MLLSEAKEILENNGYILENCLDELTEFGKKRFYRLCRLYKQTFMLETEDEAYDILSRKQNLHTYLNDKTVSLSDIIDMLNGMDL